MSGIKVIQPIKNSSFSERDYISSPSACQYRAPTDGDEPMEESVCDVCITPELPAIADFFAVIH